ncbi:hypothetical protein PsorP6_012035 [Peronosclerospora sorghi]|uniref:Uncharacterized protein n=1 Tax=Peronosclerospora sorghi TaxID=230839 RepID=A0ACC0WJG0_9STRA|nr:hypothetical protein PsorP6_012035 [Peronosclerospora sorghi]
MVNYTLDQDGDVEMKTAQPMTTGEDYKSVVASVKGSEKAKLLENLCHYILKSTVEKVTDTNILDEVNKRCGTPMNEHLPDVRELVESKLKVDMKEDDVQARILKYFSDFNTIVDDNGLQTVIGRGGADEHDSRDKAKKRSKLLIENLEPRMLREEVQHLVEFDRKSARTNEEELFQLVLDKATAQQHYYMLGRKCNDINGRKGKGSGKQRDKIGERSPKGFLVGTSI